MDGMLEAASERAAVIRLRGMGCHVVSIREVQEKESERRGR